MSHNRSQNEVNFQDILPGSALIILKRAPDLHISRLGGLELLVDEASSSRAKQTEQKKWRLWSTDSAGSSGHKAGTKREASWLGTSSSCRTLRLAEKAGWQVDWHVRRKTNNCATCKKGQGVMQLAQGGKRLLLSCFKTSQHSQKLQVLWQGPRISILVLFPKTAAE